MSPPINVRPWPLMVHFSFDVGQELGEFFFFCTYFFDEAPKTHCSMIFCVCELFSLGFSL
jgi:hypothetical protein